LDKKSLHIICLDIPYPANYGGAIDMFYKLKALHDLGMVITLHCFQYGGKPEAKELEKFCTKVYYYPRKTGVLGMDATLPYIVSSRSDKQLLKNLCIDEAPILFEGIHTTFFANHSSLALRKKLLRVHNIEADYYQYLASHTDSFFKKLYCHFEANRLQLYEKTLHQISSFSSISATEFDFFKQLYPNAIHQIVPAFHAHSEVVSLEGKGTYCLYHGNLEVEENIKAVEYIIKDVFKHLPIQLIVAGKNPSKRILNLASNNIKIIPNPSEIELNKLIQEAHINILPAFQNTGQKLKLVNALFLGRFCIANNDMVAGSGLDNAVLFSENREDMIAIIEKNMQQEFTLADIRCRKELLSHIDSIKNAQKLIDLL
jgi:glycosyltransferase involved in cell wall biosynthesis